MRYRMCNNFWHGKLKIPAIRATLINYLAWRCYFNEYHLPPPRHALAGGVRADVRTYLSFESVLILNLAFRSVVSK